MNPKTLALPCLAALVAGCAMTSAQRAPLKLTVLHTNDHLNAADFTPPAGDVVRR